jgi:asparagine synthase (glutamine-hydrolysing)
MTQAIRHRGPDGDGHHHFEDCVLGHRRLAIVDLATGAQPMLSADGNVAVTFNGEIYGYRELRRELADYHFRTTSDTEVILALYLKHGVAAVERLPGMFAFAIWDQRKRLLVCARDRFGEKPFFHARGAAGEFVFGSEIKALLASGLVTPQISATAVGRYLQRQCVAPDQTVYSNIESLPPGHVLTLQDGKCEVRRYWRFPAVDDTVDVAQAVERVRALTEQAVERQLIADVPVGAFLSGGLDSTTICQVAKKFSPGLRTFSFDFQGDHSEVPFARAAANAYQTNHTELAGAAGDVADHVLEMHRVYDEPLADSSVIPSYLLAREARRHVTVALTGDAGDELFGGYLWYQPLLWMQKEGRVGAVRWFAERIVNRALRTAGVAGAGAREKRIMGMSFAREHGSLLEAHARQLRFFDAADLAAMGLKTRNGASRYEPSFVPTGAIDDAIRCDVADYMPANNLTRTDRASMAHGLELRVPFLDVDLASYCLTLPFRLKASVTEDKIIMRRAFSERWPEQIRARRKQGFGAPVERWLAEPKVQQLQREYLDQPAAPLYGLLDFAGTRQVLARANAMQRWTLLILATWSASSRPRTAS